MDLGSKQRAFSVRIAAFILKLHELGYEVTLGEAWRPPEMEEIYRREKKGITNSLHGDRLAMDLNLFKDGKFLIQREDYLPAGELWESMSGPEIQCCYGGRWGDCDHFSISADGRK